ncbi:MAG: hypothetical protein JXR95_10255 [Deltaproteobacteria bacterium]|nr:hypothetical protein [Deltaproteobacteria bacterium]
MNFIEYQNNLFEKLRELEKKVNASVSEKQKDKIYQEFLEDIKKDKHPLLECHFE